MDVYSIVTKTVSGKLREERNGVNLRCLFDVGMRDGHVVTKSDRWVSSGHSGFLPHEDHPYANIGANEHD